VRAGCDRLDGENDEGAREIQEGLEARLLLKSKKRVKESAGNLVLRPTGRALQPHWKHEGTG
jgi:hypothetical protein